MSERYEEKAKALRIAGSYNYQFNEDFAAWLELNWHIWLAFAKESARVYARGRRHYSARTLVEWMRHETALAEKGSRFKINNRYIPDLARLYQMLYPEHDLFETRSSNVRAA